MKKALFFLIKNVLLVVERPGIMYFVVLLFTKVYYGTGLLIEI